MPRVDVNLYFDKLRSEDGATILAVAHGASRNSFLIDRLIKAAQCIDHWLRDFGLPGDHTAETAHP